MQRTSGLTLIEMIVVVMILVGLAGILTPVILNQVEKSRQAKVAADLHLISDAFNRYRLDTGYWPERYTPDRVPTTNRYFTGFSCLLRNTYNLPGWDGPYVPVDAGGYNVAYVRGNDRRGVVDPWGHYYRIFYFRKNDRYMGPGGGIVAVCTGQNGRLETPVREIAQGRARGDDQVHVVTKKL